MEQIKPMKAFYKAEAYHQDYIKKNPNGYCPDHSTGIKFSKVDKPAMFDNSQLFRGKHIVIIDAKGYCPYCEKFKSQVIKNYSGDIPLVFRFADQLSELEIGKMIESNISDQSAELCNFSVPHSIFSDWNIHIIYYNFPPSMKNISKVPLFKYINENIENNNPEDNIIVILPSNITTAVETYNGWIESINIELGKPDPDNKLYKDIVANNNYSMRHMTNVHIFNINSLCVNILCV